MVGVMKKNIIVKDESGFTLITSLMILVMLTLLGIWGLSTSTFELKIAGNMQRYQEFFKRAEGGAYVEATSVGFSGRSEYKITNPSKPMQGLTPGASYDDPSTWPSTDFFGNVAPNIEAKAKYNYFVTYMHADPTPPKGYSANAASAYVFRINGRDNIDIELGGKKLGVPFTM